MSDLQAFLLKGALLLDPEQTRDYTEITTTIAAVVESEPPLFQNDADKHHTASLILAIGWRESGLRTRIHGDCDESKPGEPCKGKPHSFGFLQLHDSSGGSEAHNDNPALCTRVGMSMLRTSMRIDPLNPISFYASGPRGYKTERAQRISRDRVALAKHIFAAATSALEIDKALR